MKKKEILNLMKLAFVAIIAMMAISVTSCGKDDDDENEPSNSYTEDDFVGYWIDDDETTVFELKSSSTLKAYTLESPGSLYYTEIFSGNWRYYERTNELVFNWDGKYPQSEVTSEGLTNTFSVIDCSLRQITLMDASGYTIYIGKHNGHLQPKEDDPVAPQFKESDFYGIWLNWIKSGYFVFNDDNTATYYWLNETGGNKLSGDSDSGKWSFDPETSTLSTSNFKKLPTRSWKVLDVTSSSIKTEDGEWLRAESLPDVVGNCDDDRIIGKWKGTDYDETYTLKFYSDGTMTETWTDGDDSETCTVSFTLKNGRLDFPDDYPIFVNVIGNPPLTVKFSSESTPKTMTISQGRTSMKFTRQ